MLLVFRFPVVKFDVAVSIMKKNLLSSTSISWYDIFNPHSYFLTKPQVFRGQQVEITCIQHRGVNVLYSGLYQYYTANWPRRHAPTHIIRYTIQQSRLTTPTPPKNYPSVPRNTKKYDKNTESEGQLSLNMLTELLQPYPPIVYIVCSPLHGGGEKF